MIRWSSRSRSRSRRITTADDLLRRVDLVSVRRCCVVVLLRSFRHCHGMVVGFVLLCCLALYTSFENYVEEFRRDEKRREELPSTAEQTIIYNTHIQAHTYANTSSYLLFAVFAVGQQCAYVGLVLMTSFSDCSVRGWPFFCNYFQMPAKLLSKNQNQKKKEQKNKKNEIGD